MEISTFRSLFNNLTAGIAIVDSSSTVLQCNKSFLDYFNLKPEIENMKICDTHPSFDDVSLSSFQDGAKLTTHTDKTLYVHTKPFEENLWLIEVDDISKAEEVNRDIHFRANYDQLTKLPNRELFNDRCKQLLSSAHRHEGNIAIFFIDVDNFKSINDEYGHDFGDLVLIETAERLSASIRESDTVSRWAGDEFSIILPNIGKQHNIDQLLKRIIENFDKAQEIKGVHIPVSLSIGISLAPDMATDFEELMRFADKAMYEAKKVDGIHYKYYSS